MFGIYCLCRNDSYNSFGRRIRGYAKGLEKAWEGVVSHLNAYGYAVYAGQQAGKMLSNLFFSTDKDVELYYSLSALYEFEDELKKALSSNESNYKSYRSNDNALFFNEAYKMLLRTHLLGVKSSQDYVDLLYVDGLLNQLLFFFREDKYNKYTEQLDSMRNSVESAISFMETAAHNAYLEEYYSTEAEIVEVYPEPVEYTEEEQEKIFTELESDSLELGNMVITNDMTLTSDIHIYGCVYLQGGTLDINGHTLEIDGDFIIADGFAEKEDGTRQYNPTTAILKMVNANDVVKVGGNFATYGVELSRNVQSKFTQNLIQSFTCFNRRSYR